ncbi:Sip1-related alpha-galactosidase [Paenibacillus contaminans]|nr:Sip1-related alpha-galactosidase [Paenibacillus contaminans]
MYRFDKKSSFIRFEGEPSVELRDIAVKAVVAGEGEVALTLKAAETTGADNGGLQAEYRLRYEDGNGSIYAELLLSGSGRFLTVRIDAGIRNETAYHAQRTFAPEGGIRIFIGSLPGLNGLMAVSRHKEWWTRPHFETDLHKLPPRTQALLWKVDAGYGYLLPVCDTLYRTDLAGAEEGMAVNVSALEAGHERISTCAFVLGADSDPYRLAAAAVREGFASRAIGGKPRESKAYPDILNYLGWCSWDAFYLEVSEEGLMRKAAEFTESGLPVRWVMIDDGWSAVRDRKLAAFSADATKFPGGLGHAVRRLKNEHGIRWVGAWHNIAGYWSGVDPQGDVFAGMKEYLYRTRSGKWIPHPEPAKSFGFWREWHSSLQREGIDFVKVDNQSSLNQYMGGERSVAGTAHDIQAGLEASVALHFGGCMINCMGMASENVWHRPLSSVSRSSNDFLPKIANGFGEHALQNAYNSVYHGPFYWGDWDMFWTSHHDAVPHMVLRAVSGGPVYFSDAPGRTNPDRIWPLIYSDGRIIRCDGIGQPTEEWLTVDPQRTAAPLKVWNTAGGAGILAAFHVYDGDDILEGDIGPGDIPGLAGDSFIVFDAIRRIAHRLQAGERVPIKVAPLEAELFVVVPISGSFTAIGLAYKLAASDAVMDICGEIDSVKVRLKDGGMFMFVSERKPVQAYVNGKPAKVEAADEPMGVYLIDCSGCTGETLADIRFA